MNLLRHSDRAERLAASATEKGGPDGSGQAGQSEPKLARRKLSATQREIVQVCEVAVQQFGFSRSVGQIYGVIYCSPRPLAFADVVESLELSSGSVSQGLRFLRAFGAIKAVSAVGDRRELFAAETELRRLLVSALQTRLREPLKTGSARLKVLKKQLRASGEPDRAFLIQRLDSLQTWHRKALLILPLVQRFLGSDRS